MLFALLLMTASLFAGGNKETIATVTTEDGTTVELHSISELMTQSPTTSSGLLYSIANVYDEITMAFCLGLTPFPNTLVQFYGGYTPDGSYDAQAKADSLQLNTALLVGDGYYNSSDGGTLSYGAKTYTGRSSETQRGIWNMITVLFVSFLLAEIVFTAIYHYIADKEGSVIKEIIAKVVMAMAIFLIASALPFIIELFRVGFTSAAATIAGLDDKLAEAGKSKEEANPPQDIDEILDSSMPAISKASLQALAEMKSLPVFNYPGTLIRSVSDVFGFMDPDDLGGTGISIDDAANDDYGWLAGTLLNGMMEIVYLFVKLVASVMVLIAALHIMYNVCEVYLLLGCVMLLLPFTIFSPLKFLGEKAVMSLFANVLELFVIVMIMFTTISIAMTVTSGLLSSILNNIKSIVVEVSIGNVDAFFETLDLNYNKVDEYKNMFEAIAEDGVVRVNVYLLTPESDSSSMYMNAVSNVESSVQIAIVLADFNGWISDQWDAILETNTANPSDDFYSLVKTTKFSWDSAGYPEEDFLPTLSSAGFHQLPARDKYAIVSYIAGDAGSAFGMAVSKSPIVDRTFDPSMSAMDIYFMHILSFLLVILMQTYFINQSSQITNALLSGNVSSEGFTGALTRIAGAKALGMAGKAAAMPGKALGGLGRFGLGAYAAKHEGTKRAAFANFAAGDNMSKLAGDLFGNKQKNQV